MAHTHIYIYDNNIFLNIHIFIINICNIQLDPSFKIFEPCRSAIQGRPGDPPSDRALFE